MAKIKSRDLTRAIQDVLEEYVEEVTEITKETVDDVTKEALKAVKKNAPVKTGAYKRSIKSKTQYESLTEKRNVIYAKDHGGLTHLLEYGHATQNGGRTKAFPHFKYGNNYIEENLNKKIRKKLGG